MRLEEALKHGSAVHRDGYRIEDGKVWKEWMAGPTEIEEDEIPSEDAPKTGWILTDD